jgi:dolichyl-diphosphooligosaccharide--protein glycosyltransferase
MKLSDALSKERITSNLKNLQKLRIKTSRSSLLTFSALLLILFVAFTIRILPLRWEIRTGGLHLSEFDAFFEYRVARYMVDNGLFSPYWPKQWVYTQLWYPQGINMGQESLPSIPMTGAFLYDLITALGVNIDLMSFASIMPTIFGTLCVLIMYFIGKDIGGKAVGMLAALFLALDASFIQRSNLGWFETETSTFAFLLFFLMFPRAIDEGRSISSTVKYSLACGACLAYFVMGWGAAYYLVDMTVLFVFVLLLLKRCTQRVFLAYSLTFGLGLLISINAPFLSLSYLTSYAVLPVALVFLLLCLNEFLRRLTSVKERLTLAAVVLAGLVSVSAAALISGGVRSIAGKFLTVLNPFLRSASPLVESVAEHRITAWGSIYYELGIMILFFFAGLFFISRNLNNRNLFLLVFGLTSLYFSASMVRLIFLLAPAFGLISAVGIMGVLRPFVVLLREAPKVTRKKFGLEHVGKEFSGTAVFLIFLILTTNFAFSPQSGGVPNVYRQVYIPITLTAGSLPVIPSQPVMEWYNALAWTGNNLRSTTVVVSWWDYGFWLTMMGNVTTLTDNATINQTQIENVGFIFMANETQSLKMLAAYHAEYVLVFVTVGLVKDSAGNTVGTWIGYGDEGKWTWMARISGEAKQRFIDDGWLPNEQSSWKDENAFGYYNSTQNRWIWNDMGMNTTVYKLMSWGKQRWCNQNGITPDVAGVQPTYFDEAYFAGETLSPSDAAKYGNIIPLVCLYRINWDKYYSSLGQ